MNEPVEKISPDDPRLTAYALGELDGAERATIEAALSDDGALAAAVREIRATGAQLEDALATEPLPEAGAPPLRETPALGRAAIIAGKDLKKLDGGPGGELRDLIRFPQAYYLISGLAAACFVIFIATRAPDEKPRAKVAAERREVRTIVLSATAPAQAEAGVTLPEAAPVPGVVAPPVATVPSKFETMLATTGREKKISLLDQAMARVQGGLSGLDLQGRFASVDGTGTAKSRGALQVGSIALDGPRGVIGPSRRATVFVGAQTGLLTGNRVHTFAGDDKFVVEARARGVTTVDRAAATREMPGTEAYAQRKDNGFVSAAENPLSTFAADVDTASYANVRRMLRAGKRPPADAVRVEEMLNYFSYRYAPPTGAAAGGAPAFAASLEVAEAPWAAGHRLVRIGLKAREVAATERGAANLVFLVDVSGSMDRPERLPLVKESLRLLVSRLRPTDRVAIVTYAGASGLALASTPVMQAREIATALEAMTPGGATNGGMGIQLAYDIARANFVTGGVNRVILCTDGDFNVGVTGEGELVRLVQEKAKSGVFLTVLGFGMGNLKDSMLEAIADKGNGSYGYIDSRREAEKLLSAQVNGTLTTVAKDVKLQVEFNPARVASYRLIGYENRLLGKEQFNDDQGDAGEIGAGHTMTALYEVVPAETAALALAPGLDDLKYARKAVTVPAVAGDVGTSPELLTLKVRYKEPAGDESRKLEFTLTDAGARFAEASGDFKFASAVAAFGMILRDSPHKGTATLNDVATWAEEGAADDPGGWRGEFVELARVADGAR